MVPPRLSHFKGLPEEFDSCLYEAGWEVGREEERERGESIQERERRIHPQSDTVTDSREKRGRLQSFKGLRKWERNFALSISWAGL